MNTTPSQALPPPPATLVDRASLFLDFDGTLVEIESRPDGVKVEARLLRLLSALSSRLGGRVALVSGRPVEQLRSLLGSPAYAIAGSHGVELHWPDGRVVSPAIDGRHADTFMRLRRLEKAFPGVVVEHKPFGIALHFRQAPDAAEACRHEAERTARETGFVIQEGKMVVELKISGATKGVAVEAFMSEAPMKGTVPVFIGDDETDEAGFVMAAKLGGAGIVVGSRRPTAASYCLPDVGSTLEWLEAASGTGA